MMAGWLACLDSTALFVGFQPPSLRLDAILPLAKRADVAKLVVFEVLVHHSSLSPVKTALRSQIAVMASS